MSLSKLNPVEPPRYVTRMPGGVGGVAPRGVPLSPSIPPYRRSSCRRNIEMTSLCKVAVTLRRVLGSRRARRGGGVDEQAGVQPATLPPAAGRDKWKGSRDRSGIGIPRIDDEEARGPEWRFVAGRDREIAGCGNRGDLPVGNRDRVSLPASADDDLRIGCRSRNIKRDDAESRTVQQFVVRAPPRAPFVACRPAGSQFRAAVPPGRSSKSTKYLWLERRATPAPADRRVPASVPKQHACPIGSS